MNWTGGSLQRTKKVGNGTLQKQKAYFARVRTNLQNGPRPSPLPFRPGHLDPFEPHDATERHDISNTPIPSRFEAHSAVRKAHTNRDISHITAQPQLTRGNTGVEDIARGNRDDRKRKNFDPSLESHLLEANKKRLLQQHDWAGLAGSKPAHMHFQSAKEKRKVGKRRRVPHKQEKSIRENEYSQPVIPPHQPRSKNDFTGHTRSVVRIKPEDIRIRIGTDALCSTQLSDCNQSHGSSDPMLLDEHIPDSHEPGLQEALTIQGHAPQSFERINQQDHDLHPERLVEDEQIVHQTSSDHFQSFVHPCDHHMQDPTRLEMDSEPAKMDLRSPSDHGRSLSPGPRIMQHADGVQQPLRLVFSTTDNLTGTQSYTNSQHNSNRGTKHALKASYAGSPLIGHTHHARSSAANASLSENEAAAPNILVDEEPWKSFLCIPDHSSSYSPMMATQDPKKMHDRAMSREGNNHTQSPQHAMQDSYRLTKPSLNPTALPYPKKVDKAHSPTHEGTAETGRSMPDKTTPRAQSDNGEELWQQFVLGDVGGQLSYASFQHNNDRGSRVWRGSSGYLPLSAAVSSISPSPPVCTSRPASRFVNSEQNVTRFALSSGSVGLSSPAARPAFADREALDAAMGEEARVVGSTTGDQSVTHASLWNNASCEAAFVSSRMASNTRTSRSGYMYPRQTNGSTSRRAHCSGSATRRQIEQLAVCDSSDSDSDGLDLIDPERTE